MRKHDEKLEHQISGALDDKDLEKVAGGDKAVKVTHDDAGPKELLSLTFGSLQIKYSQQ